MFDKIVLVTRKTRLAQLVERFNTRAQAKFYLERSGGDFDDYLREDPKSPCPCSDCRDARKGDSRGW